MEFRKLGRTGLKVSALCLGTMQWGWTADEKTAFDVMDAFMEAGGNFIDTADVYSRWVEGNPGGVSEEVIGRWMKERGNRSQVVLATKVRGQMGPGPNDQGLSRRHIMEAVDASLRRLQTDYIDLYQTHSSDPETPIDETLRTLDDLQRAGKVRYVGASNYKAWELMEALWSASENGTVRYDSLQPKYNLVTRAEFERELKPVCEKYHIGVIPYSPLAAGFLTGKYTRDKVAESKRAAGVQNQFATEQGFQILDAVQAVAGETESNPAAVSLAWLLAQPVISSPIIGANSRAQLQDSLDTFKVKLSEEQIKRLNEASNWR
ncbi:MAG TPA: aldo/keto reductase [Chloroflexia bacterium]|nr:aldo/keto reductase [Chloroflexia bacterium]